MKNDMPVHSKKMARNGKVKRSRFRRPQVSMVKKAGMAKIQFRIPVPIEAKRALLWLYPPWMKMVVE